MLITLTSLDIYISVIFLYKLTKHCYMCACVLASYVDQRNFHKLMKSRVDKDRIEILSATLL